MAFLGFGKKQDIEENSSYRSSYLSNDMAYRVANLHGVGKRARQEDSFTVANALDDTKVKEQGLFFAVCDGMGGMKDGKIASETAVGCLRRDFLYMDRNGDIAVQLKDSLFRASAEVERIIGGEGGCTAIVGIIYKERLYYAGVGDSFFYLLRDGILYRINREHNLCHQNYYDLVREGYIDPGDYQDRPEATSLTQFLGMIGLNDIDWLMRPLPVESGDVLLACSDGVAGVLNEDEIRTALSAPTEKEMCDRLEQRLVDYNMANQDNYTALVVKCI